MTIEARDFHLEEYKALRKEIDWMLKDYHALERNIAFVCGGVLVWLFGKASSDTWMARDLGWFIPFFFAFLGSVRAFGIFHAFDIYHEYLLKLEDALASGMELGGWDHFLSKKSDGQEKRRPIGTSRFATVFWLSLDLVTLLIGVLFGLHLVKYA